MAYEFQQDMANEVPAGTVIYKKGEMLQTICLVLKGKVEILNRGIRIEVGNGSFLGLNDLPAGVYQNDYTVKEDATVWVFPIQKEEEITNIIEQKIEYGGFMIAYFNKYIAELFHFQRQLAEYADKAYLFFSAHYKKYLEICLKYEVVPEANQRFEEYERYQKQVELEENKIKYYTECTKITTNAQKNYFIFDLQNTYQWIMDQIKQVNDLSLECEALITYIVAITRTLIGCDGSSLYDCLINLEVALVQRGKREEDIEVLVELIREEANEVDMLLNQEINYTFELNKERIELAYAEFLAAKKGRPLSQTLSYSKEEQEFALKETKDILERILQYAEYEEEQKDKIKETIQEFKKVPDKFSTSDKVRKIRKELVGFYYDLYETVFLKWYRQKDEDRFLQLFLDFGVLDESLLAAEQLIELYYLQEQEKQTTPCKVYTIKEWLVAVFEEEKEPSKNEFDLDYQGNLRELKRSGEITEQEEKEYLSNPEKKLHYEIQNLFRCNHKTVNGQITTFVPILHQDMFTDSIVRTYNTSKKVNDAFQWILEIDFSIFHREILYYDSKKDIKEQIMKQVCPDIILIPTSGTNPIMWQEITGKKRDTSGRILLPLFSMRDLHELVIQVCGRFRWELCRTMQGLAWNDIQNKSLTSEYCDYIQYYRKNRLLSEEAKKKVKAQIQKGRNNSREIFVLDYIIWIKFESQGSLRLNRPAREILAMYCPFCKRIREKINTQPLFAEAMGRYRREKQKKINALDLKFRVWHKDNVDIPEELIETEHFYKDL